MNPSVNILAIATFIASLVPVLADTTNPILDDPPGTLATERCILTESPDGSGYLLTLRTVCPVGTRTVPVAVDEPLDVRSVLGQETRVTVRVDPGRTFTVVAVEPPGATGVFERGPPPPTPHAPPPAAHAPPSAPPPTATFFPGAALVAAVIITLLIAALALGKARPPDHD